MQLAMLRCPLYVQARAFARLATVSRSRCTVPVRWATTTAAYDPSSAGEAPKSRVYSAYQLYKGKAAASFKVIRPQWQSLPDGSYTISRAGTLLVEVAPAQQGTGTRPGERRYEWDSKVTFALSASELGEMIASQGRGIQPIFHDPGMNTGAQGQKTKSFRYQLMSQDSQDLYLQVEMNESGKQQQRYGLPVTRGEHEVITRIAKFIIPHLLGIDEVLQQAGEALCGLAGGAAGAFLPSLLVPVHLTENIWR
ncbi:hypothetical protein WJX74_010313 [Apatococcus lobatus]|uniref:Uncharacterized protein n=1 Tax=Apatococcus lobatus TaxID=904363 RepID=A0AAW1QHR0_9CHLO